MCFEIELCCKEVTVCMVILFLSDCWSVWCQATWPLWSNGIFYCFEVDSSSTEWIFASTGYLQLRLTFTHVFKFVLCIELCSIDFFLLWKFFSFRSVTGSFMSDFVCFNIQYASSVIPNAVCLMFPCAAFLSVLLFCAGILTWKHIYLF